MSKPLRPKWEIGTWLRLRCTSCEEIIFELLYSDQSHELIGLLTRYIGKPEAFLCENCIKEEEQAEQDNIDEMFDIEEGDR